ncbi:hypothetical protein DFH09DRAFT_372063 [Mycena vulgaris]|nr:hypothetical protein DFH09DRAFT_372063 [Mycena vulgaris]
MRFTISSLALLSLATLSRAAVVSDDLAARTYPTSTTGISATTCACISGNFQIGGHDCGTFQTELCTCISILVNLVGTTSRAPLLEGRRYGGYDKTYNALKDKINNCGKQDKQTCYHPENSSPNCSRKNLCGYTCDKGYVDCNGKCKTTCSTGSISNPSKRDNAYWGHRVQKSCQAGWTACGVLGGGPRDWECLNIANDLESCGGCPTGTVSSLTGVASGADCTAIANVADVSCVAGGCAVEKCIPGYKVSASGTTCEENRSLFRNTLHAAASYGLEHLPFRK